MENWHAGYEFFRRETSGTRVKMITVLQWPLWSRRVGGNLVLGFFGKELDGTNESGKRPRRAGSMELGTTRRKAISEYTRRPLVM